MSRRRKVMAQRTPSGRISHKNAIELLPGKPQWSTRPVHELERYMRCKDCSQVRGYPYKRSHLVALRATKITASDPPSTWWPGER